MLARTLTTRSVVFAYLLGPPRFVAREGASKIYEAVCQALKVEDFAFHYTTTDVSPHTSTKGFCTTLERKEGRGQFRIRFENRSIHTPMRVLFEFDWPPQIDIAGQQIDIASDAVFASIEGETQRVLAEVRLRAQSQAPGNDATSYIATKLMKLRQGWLDSLGNRLSFASMRVDVPASRPDEESSLSNPLRELSIEVLREQPGGIYVELMSQWMQVPAVAKPGAAIDVASLRPIDRVPSEYIRNAYTFLWECLKDLGEQEGEQQR